MTDLLLLGYGTIGRDLERLLRPELERGEVRVIGALVRDPSKRRDESPDFPLIQAEHFATAVTDADVVVECAGVAAAREYGPQAIGANRDLVLASVGALADPIARLGMLSGPGSLTVTNGAIGGFDLLGAAAQAGGLDDVSIRTAKLASALVQPWMRDAERERLEALAPGDEAVEVFAGSPDEAIAKFPANVNIAVALAWATRELLPADASARARSGALGRALDRVRVSLLADPDATLSSHRILASGPAGDYELRLRNAPSPSNPRTSGLTAMSVARDLRELLARRGA